jgi:hypothetical protein
MFLRRKYLGPRPSALKEYLSAQRLLAEEEKRLVELAQRVAKGKQPLAELAAARQLLAARRAAADAAFAKVLDELDTP